ncbi:MAG: TRAP transporter large permease, partial [Candidatus Atribacteria bacterium]|nr:TRAP transporter large permease [Candidatus Atribacteria bacterium]
MAWLMFLGFFILIIIGLPIPFSMGISAIFYIILSNIPLAIVAQRFFSNMQSFPFFAVPFFILSGHLMMRSGVSTRIINFVNSVIGKLPGALGCVSVIVSMILAGVSGSSVADAASTGAILIPEMKKRGYTSSFSAAINATSSVVGIIIPPSSTMIIIAWITNLSVLKLFLAGAIPGIILGLSYLVLTIVISKKRNFPTEEVGSWKTIFKYFKECIWVLFFPLILVYSLVFGVATVTEVAAVAAFYSFLIGFFVYRSLNWNGLKMALVDSAKNTAVVMAMVCSANIFSWVLIRENIPKVIARAVLSIGLPDPLLLFALVFILFLAGMIGDLVPNLFIFIPIFFPIILEMGVDPIHFATVLLIALALGLFTPPVGATLFISCSIAKIGIEEIFWDLVPYFIVGA